MLLDEQEMKNVYNNLSKDSYVCVDLEIKLFQKQRLISGNDASVLYLFKMAERIDQILNKQEFTCITPQHHVVFFWCMLHSDDVYQRIKLIDDMFEDVSLSFGIYYPEPDDVFEQTILFAQCAKENSIDHSKHSTSYDFYDPSLYEATLHEYLIHTYIEKAIKQGELQIFLQPKVTLKNEKLSGAEALIRWIHKDKQIPLQDFMPIVNRNSFIRTIDLFVYQQVGEFLLHCRKQKLPLFPISVNISKASYLDRVYYLQEIKRINKTMNIPIEAIHFELSESILYEKEVEMEAFMKELLDLGYLISMDDFGSGSSSLSALSYLPFHTIKLDQCFFQQECNERSSLLLKHVLKMLKELDFYIVAEGVEKPQWVQFLKKYKCDEIQGFYYYKPMPMSQYANLLKK